MNESKKSILLVRVSTLSQDYTAQKDDLIKYSKSLGINEYHIIEDKESAIKLSEEERNGLNSMKDWIKDHPDYNTVIVWEISRLARSEKVLHSIKDYFLQNHIQLYIYDKKYKLLNEDGSENQETGLLFSLYAYFAESEMKIKKERFKRSKRMNGELGKFNGGSVVKFGYKINEDNYIVPDEADAKVVKEIFQMYSTGDYSIPQVTKEFNLRGYNLTKHYITEMLSFTGYIGYTNYGGHRRSHRNFIPIIDKELFDKVQQVKLLNSTVITKSKRYYFCNKIIKCPECGGSYIFKSGVYSCMAATMTGGCDYRVSIDSKWCDIIVWYIALQSHKDFLNIDIDTKINNTFDEIKSLQKKIIFTQNQINKVNKKYERANMLFINMKINEAQYKQIEDNISNEIKVKEGEIKQYESEINNKEVILNSLSKNSVEVSDSLSLKEMKEIVLRYVYKIYLYRGKVHDKIADKLEVFYYKVNSNGDLVSSKDYYYFFPYRKSARYEFNDEVIDDKIKEVCGNTLNAILNDKRRTKERKNQ